MASKRDLGLLVACALTFGSMSTRAQIRPTISQGAVIPEGWTTDVRFGASSDGTYQELDLGYQFESGLGVVFQLHNMLILNAAVADEFDRNSLAARAGLRYILFSGRFRAYLQATYGVGVVTGWLGSDPRRFAWMSPVFQSVSTTAAVEYRVYTSRSSSREVWLSFNGGLNMVVHSGLFRNLPGMALGASFVW